ncbi:hypothetical protein FB451DRAFT_1178977 [Mycena latifolia]|nr:hypothetical protein FB451DRAFT_1178977 [Mycena latifolia]
MPHGASREYTDPQLHPMARPESILSSEDAPPAARGEGDQVKWDTPPALGGSGVVEMAARVTYNIPPAREHPGAPELTGTAKYATSRSAEQSVGLWGQIGYPAVGHTITKEGFHPPMVERAGVYKLRQQARTRTRKRGSNGCRGSGKQGPRMRVRILLGYRRASSVNEGAGRGNEGATGRKTRRGRGGIITRVHTRRHHALSTATRQQQNVRAARPCCRADEHPNPDKDSDLPPNIDQPLS